MEKVNNSKSEDPRVAAAMEEIDNLKSKDPERAAAMLELLNTIKELDKIEAEARAYNREQKANGSDLRMTILGEVLE